MRAGEEEKFIRPGRGQTRSILSDTLAYSQRALIDYHANKQLPGQNRLQIVDTRLTWTLSKWKRQEDWKQSQRRWFNLWTFLKLRKASEPI
jgi:hypothetical protein